MIRFLFANRRAIVVAGTLGLGSDLTCQLIQASSWRQAAAELDWRRSARFASIWFTLVAPLNLGWFHLLSRYGVSPFKSVLLDQSLFYPFLLSVIITSNQAVACYVTREIDELNIEQKARESLDIVPVALSYWVPVQFVNYSLIPLAMRLVYVQCAAFIFNVYLSMRLN